MHIIEYIDEKTKQGTGRYAKRTKDPLSGIESDEIIPKKCFCVCDSLGNIKSITEVAFSHSIEVEGKEHCLELEAGEECNRISDADMPQPPIDEKDHLKWMVDNFKMGKKDLKGKRKIIAKT